MLETAGPYWAAKQVRGVYSISNGLTLGSEWDSASPGLVEYAVERGWCRGPEDFHFARCYSDFLYTTFSDCRRRRSRTMALLQARSGQITPSVLMGILRDHGEGTYRPDHGMAGTTVCMHASFGPIRFSQTVGSMVSHVREGAPTHFFTGTAGPCTSTFKPLWVDAGLPDAGPVPEGYADPAALYWRHERLHRTVLRDHAPLLARFSHERDELERAWVDAALSHADAAPELRFRLSEHVFAEAQAAEDRWLEHVAATPAVTRRSPFHAGYWHRMDREAGLDLLASPGE